MRKCIYLKNDFCRSAILIKFYIQNKLLLKLQAVLNKIALYLKLKVK